MFRFRNVPFLKFPIISKYWGGLRSNESLQSPVRQFGFHMRKHNPMSEKSSKKYVEILRLNLDSDMHLIG